MTIPAVELYKMNSGEPHPLLADLLVRACSLVGREITVRLCPDLLILVLGRTYEITVSVTGDDVEVKCGTSDHRHSVYKATLLDPHSIPEITTTTLLYLHDYYRARGKRYMDRAMGDEIVATGLKDAAMNAGSIVY